MGYRGARQRGVIRPDRRPHRSRNKQPRERRKERSEVSRKSRGQNGKAKKAGRKPKGEGETRSSTGGQALGKDASRKDGLWLKNNKNKRR